MKDSLLIHYYGIMFQAPKFPQQKILNQGKMPHLHVTIAPKSNISLEHPVYLQKWLELNFYIVLEIISSPNQGSIEPTEKIYFLE